jgi:hypothetical protein
LPQESRIEALDKEIAALQEQIRQLDDQVAAAQAKTGGLDPAQWHMAMDRLQYYLDFRRRKQEPCGFSKAEIAALDARHEKLKAILG